MSHHGSAHATTAPAVAITHEHVQAWLDAYARGWETYHADDVAALFTEDATYRYHPADEPVRGRDEIVRSWVAPEGNESGRDAEGTYRGEYRPYAVEGNRAVAVGTSTYWKDASRAEVDRIYYNSWLLEFGPDGRCSSFTEYYMKPRER